MGTGPDRKKTTENVQAEGFRATPAALAVTLDPHKAYVFPNRMREQRRAHGFPKLLRLAAMIPEIPYIRLSKIERGEVFPRADELRRIAAALGIAAVDLLLDIDAQGFDIAVWALPFEDGRAVDEEEERFAVLLGAALRARRTIESGLSIAAIERDYGLPPVNLSRVENAVKPFGRWNAAVKSSLFSIFAVRDEAALRAHVAEQHHSGVLDLFLALIFSPDQRRAKTRVRIADLADQLRKPAPAALPDAAPEGRVEPATLAAGSSASAQRRLLQVHGTPLADGLIAFTPTAEQIEAPATAGPHAFALRVCRQTLGGGLPGQAIVIIDPARYPVAGGLAAVREGDAYRLLAVTIDRNGSLSGYSLNPDLEISIDGRDTTDVAAVVAAIFP